MSDISTFLRSSEVRDLLDSYIDGRLDEEQLIGQLVPMKDMAADDSEDTLASVLSALIARTEMIHLNICRAEQRHAIVDVLTDFEKSHIEGT